MLTPFRQDTNSLHLTEKLNDLGVEVAFKTIVGDSREHLASTALLALSRSDVIIFMGGLGPTEDDLTREAVADALGLPLGGIPRFSRGLRKDSPHINSRCRPTILSKPMSLLELPFYLIQTAPLPAVDHRQV